MARKDIIFKKFSFSLGELKQLADSYVILLDRDIAEFTDRGYTPEKRAALVEAIEVFAKFSTDEQMEGRQMTATAAREATRVAVEKQVRTIQQAAKTVFNESPAKFRTFGNSDLTRQNDDKLLRIAKQVVRNATRYLSSLAAEGITAEKIAALNAARTTFDNAVDAQIDAMNNRDTAAETRAELANALYALISKYSEIGKDIWIEESEARYNDYVIYDTPATE
jgi:hypothetical protein